MANPIASYWYLYIHKQTHKSGLHSSMYKNKDDSGNYRLKGMYQTGHVTHVPRGHVDTNSFEQTYSLNNNLNWFSILDRRSSFFLLRLSGMENLFKLLIYV